MGIPGGVCPSSWTDKEATAVCRQRGYSGGLAYRQYPPLIKGPFWFTNVTCTGYENSLLDCRREHRGESTGCNETRYWYRSTEKTAAGVLCWPAKTGKLPVLEIPDGHRTRLLRNLVGRDTSLKVASN